MRLSDTSSNDELFDFKSLSPQDFELLVGALLSQSGSPVIAQSRPGQNAPDFEAISPTGERMIVEVKHYRQPIPSAIVRQFSGDIARARLQMPNTKGLLVVSGDLSSAARQAIVEEDGLDVWTGHDVRRLLQRFPNVANAAANSAAASQLLQMMATAAAAPMPPRPLSAQFEDRLVAIKAGKDDWSMFEDWGTEILTEIFKPDLGPPDQQTRTDDGLDIMDAIFPIRAGSPPWALVRAEYGTRFAVAEYKNYTGPIGPKQVESIQQYLWIPAKRQFGLLVSRELPAPQAIVQRRRAWLEHQKMIVFLSATDLIGMLEMRENGEEPFEVIDAQLEEFFRTLSP
ncbi:restriction endonuclease [Sphingobium sp. CR2-8]|uniref:restriction endonuclease n=1 Tax=Sphingobium sp. CR2-8 TaxID=1306534 RepID=UPI002DB8BA9B|nr:restriction endonuclease [Sphingobium sp. CR2-8]MEC3910318.1 restriction endonuclease [Sphingobium sp. CR2-8]